MLCMEKTLNGRNGGNMRDRVEENASKKRSCSQDKTFETHKPQKEVLFFEKHTVG